MIKHQNKTDISKTFGISRQSVIRAEADIREQIHKGRYNDYAILDDLINIAVFADYWKYRKRLRRNLSVPQFNANAVFQMISEVNYEE